MGDYRIGSWKVMRRFKTKRALRREIWELCQERGKMMREHWEEVRKLKAFLSDTRLWLSGWTHGIHVDHDGNKYDAYFPEGIIMDGMLYDMLMDSFDRVLGESD